MRILLNGYPLFDSTYIPEYIYNKIPSIRYGGFKFVDPIFQKIDQYTSLSLLFEVTGPSYNVSYRLKKDIKRKNILSQYYNLKSVEYKVELTPTTIEINDTMKEIQRLQVSRNGESVYDKDTLDYTMMDNKENYYSIDLNITHHGVIAYSLYYSKFQEIIKGIIEIPEELLKDISIQSLPSIHKNGIEVSIPKDMPITFINANNNIEKIAQSISGNYKKYEGLSVSIPNYYYIGRPENSIIILDLYGKCLSVNHLKINNDIFIVSNYNYLLAYFLFNFFMEDNDDLKAHYRCYYLSLLSMVKIINYLYIEKKIKDLTPFTYSINTLGSINQSENYFYFVRNFNNLVAENKNLNDLPPKNYLGYPNCKLKKEFNSENSPFYNKFQKEVLHTNFAEELIKLKFT